MRENLQENQKNGLVLCSKDDKRAKNMAFLLKKINFVRKSFAFLK
jgi:hypothetical protein